VQQEQAEQRAQQQLEDEVSHDQREHGGATEHAVQQEQHFEDQSENQHETYAEETWSDGKIIALTASLLPEFSILHGARNCLDMPPPCGLALAEKDRDVLRDAANSFFSVLPEPAGALEHGTERPARRMRTEHEIVESWQELFRRRRAVQSNDTEVADETQVKSVWKDWCADWLEHELRPDQMLLRPSQKTSIFNVWVRKTYGSKHVLCGLLETGLTWAPPQEFVGKDFDGAAEHVAKNFVLWFQRLIESMRRHKEDPDTVAACARSFHGLTHAQMMDRRRRDAARNNLNWAKHLESCLLASKGKGKGYNPEGKARSWEYMSRNDQWWLCQLWHGNLQREVERAKAVHGGRVQAKPFRVSE
jgi:hypothetical protein